MLEVKHPKSKERRDRMRELGICINASFLLPRPDGTPRKPPAFNRPMVEHGPVVAGGKCQRCIDVHKLSEQSRAQTMRGVPMEAPPGAPGRDQHALQ
jgi:hypothetical protein